MFQRWIRGWRETGVLRREGKDWGCQLAYESRSAFCWHYYCRGCEQTRRRNCWGRMYPGSFDLNVQCPMIPQVYHPGNPPKAPSLAYLLLQYSRDNCPALLLFPCGFFPLNQFGVLVLLQFDKYDNVNFGGGRTCISRIFFLLPRTTPLDRFKTILLVKLC